MKRKYIYASVCHRTIISINQTALISIIHFLKSTFAVYLYSWLQDALYDLTSHYLSFSHFGGQMELFFHDYLNKKDKLNISRIKYRNIF